jgi:MFS family permease
MLNITPAEIIGADEDSRNAGAPTGILLLLMTTLAVMGNVLISPVLPRMIEHFSALGPHAGVLVPLVVVVPALLIGLTSPVAGIFTDTFGRKTVLLVAFVVYAAAGTAPCWLDSIYAIIASRVFVGLAEAGVMTASTTLIADCFGGARRQRWLAGQTGMATVAAVVLIALGGILGERGWRTPFYAYALALCFILPSLWLLPSRKRQALSFAQSVHLGRALKPIVWLCILTILGGMGFYIMPIHIGLVLASRGITSPATIGIAAAVSNLATPVGSLIYSRISARPAMHLLALSFVVMGAGLFIVGEATNFGPTMAGAVVANLGSGLLLPVLISTSTMRLPAMLRGQGVGLWTASFFLGQFFSPLSVAALNVATHGIGPTIAIFGLLSCAMAIGCMVQARFGRRVPAASTSDRPISQ